MLLSGQHQLFLKTSSIRRKQMFGFQKREEKKNGNNIRLHQTWTEGEGKHDVWFKNISFNKDSDIKISICNTHTRRSRAEPHFGCFLMTLVGTGRACPCSLFDFLFWGVFFHRLPGSPGCEKYSSIKMRTRTQCSKSYHNTKENQWGCLWLLRTGCNSSANSLELEKVT